MAKGEDQDYRPDLEAEDEITLSPAGGEPKALTYKTGQVVGNDYILDELLGRGGMGVVFAARHRFIDQKYAVKILAPELLTERNWLRFQREAQSLARLNHESIVRIYNMGIDKESCPYYVMEFLKGETLAERLNRLGPMPVDEALDCFGAIASALQAAHKQQIIHRDIKPSNIILVSEPESRAGRYKLVDFGLARVLTDSSNRLISLRSERDRQSLTEIGEIFGSPYYMSPEQCRGEPLDQRTDIYSFGCSLYEALTGKVPLKGATVLQTFMMHQSMDPEPLNAAYPSGRFSADLELAVSRMMAKNAASRYQDVEALLHDFQRLQSGKTLLPQAISTIVSEQKYLPADGSSADIVVTAFDGDAKQTFAALATRPALILVLGLCIILGLLSRYYLTIFQPSAGKTSLQKMGTGALNVVSLPNPDAITTEPVLRKPGPGNAIRLTFPRGYQSVQIFDANSKFVDFAYGAETKVIPPINLCFSLLKDSPEFLQCFGENDVSILEIENFRFKEHLMRFRSLMKGWKRLHVCIFEDASLNDDCAQWLSEYPSLSNLTFQHSRMSAKSLAGAEFLPRLTYLRLSKLTEDEAGQVPFQTDQFLKSLDRASVLKQLELESLPFTEEGLVSVCRHRSLEIFKVTNHNWTVPELKMLDGARQIGCIKIDYKDLGEPAWQYVKSLRPALGSRGARFTVDNRPDVLSPERPEDLFRRDFRAKPLKSVPSF